MTMVFSDTKPTTFGRWAKYSFCTNFLRLAAVPSKHKFLNFSLFLSVTLQKFLATDRIGRGVFFFSFHFIATMCARFFSLGPFNVAKAECDVWTPYDSMGTCSVIYRTRSHRILSALRATYKDQPPSYPRLNVRQMRSYSTSVVAIY